jgi:hypothetical protein
LQVRKAAEEEARAATSALRADLANAQGEVQTLHERVRDALAHFHISPVTQVLNQWLDTDCLWQPHRTALL